MKALIVLLLIGCMQSVFGQDDQLLELCQGIHRYQAESRQSPRQALWRTLRLRFFPSLYSKPLSQKIPGLKPLKAPEVLGQKNMVFFVGLPENLVESAEDFKDDYQLIQKELLETTKKFSFLAKSKSVEECVALAQARSVDLESLKIINQKIQSRDFQNFQRLKETQTFRRELRQLEGQLSSDWHARVVTHISDLHQALRSPEIANVVIVTHGKLSGHIIDSFDHQYPNGFFADLSPSLYSLSFFNCYGEATLSTYDLKARLAQAPSFYTQRLVTVANAPSTADADQVAPIKGFDSFMRRLDRSLRQRERFKVKASETVAPKLCQLELSGQSSGPSAALSLNGKFLGMLSQGMSALSFPCEWRKPQANLLQLTNISAQEWDLTEAPEILGFEKQVFKTSQGTLRSVLYRDL